MAAATQNSYRGALVRIALWSLASLVCYWLPLLAAYLYYQRSVYRIMWFNMPLLGLATVMVIRSLGKAFRALRLYPKGRRCALGLAAVAASVPVLAALEHDAYVMIVLAYGIGMLFE